VTPIKEVKKILMEKLEVQAGSVVLKSAEHGLLQDKMTLKNYKFRSGHLIELYIE
jgi:hypothetical protein